MPFEEFDKRSAGLTKSPFVTIQRKGPFSMNKAAYALAGEPQAVSLFYDPEEQLIGFKPRPPDYPRAFPVRPQGATSSTYVIAGHAFSQHYGIDTSVARRYAVEMRDDMLVLDLKSTSIDATGPRLKHRDREPV